MSQYPEIELNYRDMEPPFCWKDIFGNSAPVEIEIGFGKYGFLIHLAALNSGSEFFRDRKVMEILSKGLKNCNALNLHNVKLL